MKRIKQELKTRSEKGNKKIVDHEKIKEILRQLEKVKAEPTKKEQKTGPKEIKEIEEPKKAEKRLNLGLMYEINKSLYEQSIKQLDYGKLFSYVGKEYKDPYQAFIEELKKYSILKDNSLTEEQLERIIRREQTNIMLGNSMDRIDVDEKEKYKYWKMCNRLMNMIKIDIAKVGEGAAGVFYV